MKVVALMDRARTEPRDLYDTWFLLTGAHVAPADLLAAVEARWVFRGKTLQEVRGAFRAKEARYRRLWEPRLAPQMVELPPFEVVYCGVARSWRRAGAIRWRAPDPRGRRLCSAPARETTQYATAEMQSWWALRDSNPRRAG